MDGFEKKGAASLRKLEARKGRTEGALSIKKRPMFTSCFDKKL